MGATVALALALSSLVAAPAHSEIANGGTVDRSPDLTVASFQDPPTSTRAKFRYWIPLGFTTKTQIDADLKAMADIGAGGFEIAAFPIQGITVGDPRLDTYGWGTPKYTENYKYMLKQAKAYGIAVDSTLGPYWPATTPDMTNINDVAAEKQLVYTYKYVDAGGNGGATATNYAPAIPAGATSTLVASVAVQCVVATCVTQSTGSRQLVQSTAVDLTADAADGTYAWNAPAGDGTEKWAIVSFYQTAAAQIGPAFGSRNLSNTTSADTVVYVTDHLSIAGTRASTDYWDDHLLDDPQVQSLIKDIGRGDVFEDSLELKNATMTWTPEFIDAWKEKRGYNPRLLLPALAGASKGAASTPFFDFASTGVKVRNDYKKTWGDLYLENRVKPLGEWAAGYGMQARGQAYGEPLETPYVGSFLDTPEVESFGQSNNAERYKIGAAGAHQNGNTVVGIEAGAASGLAWATTQAGSTNGAVYYTVNTAFAGGVTEVTWHGFPYSTYPEGAAANYTTWPGATFEGNTSFAEAWGSRMPQWDQERTAFDYIARNQLALRQGQAKFDVGVYKETLDMTSSILTNQGPVSNAGFTSEPLSVSFMVDEDATFENGELLGDTTGYNAVVVPSITTMRLDAALKLKALGQSGLPIVIIGAGPTTTFGYSTHATQDDADLVAAIAAIRALPTTSSVAAEADVPAALTSLGIKKTAATATAVSGLQTVHRSAEAADYYFLYNAGTAAIDTPVTLSAEGQPYVLDAFTGDITPVAKFDASDGSTTVDLQLKPQEAMLLAVSGSDPWGLAPEGPSVTSADAGVSYVDGELVLRSTSDGAYDVELSDDQARTATISGTPGTIAVDNWNLTVNSWTPGPSGAPGDTAVTPVGPVALVANPTTHLLPSWSTITPGNGYSANLTDLSGVGDYSSTFELPQGWTGGLGAYLDLGTATDTVDVSINGHAITAVDANNLNGIDLQDYLVTGTNTIVVHVASTLRNAVRIYSQPSAAAAAKQNYGLFGPVAIRPFGEVAIDTDAPAATVLPAITGVAAVDQELTASEGTWNVDDLEFSYQWLRNGDEIEDATDQTYTTVPSDVGDTISVRVTTDKDGYLPGSAESLGVEIAEGGLQNAAPPVVSGTLKVGSTLTSSTGVWTLEDPTFSYQWLRSGTAIAGATGKTYKVVIADAGQRIRVRVTASADGYTTKSALSAQSAVVPKVAPKASVKLTDSSISKKSKGVVEVTLSSTAGTPTGTVVVHYGSGKTKTVTLTTASKGKASVTLPTLKAGKYKVYAVYKGSSTYSSATSTQKTLTVK